MDALDLKVSKPRSVVRPARTGEDPDGGTCAWPVLKFTPSLVDARESCHERQWRYLARTSAETAIVEQIATWRAAR